MNYIKIRIYIKCWGLCKMICNSWIDRKTCN